MLICGKDNPRLKELKKLLRDRRYREETGTFVIEGARSCADAARDFLEGGRPVVRGVYYVPERLERAHADVGAILGLPEEKRFQLTEQAAERLGETESSQGVFAVAEMLHRQMGPGCLREAGKYLVMNGIQDPGNLGTMLRTADAVGVDGVVLTGSCVDLYNPKVVRAAMGSMPRLEIFIERDFRRAVELFHGSGIRLAAAVVSGGTDIMKADLSGGRAVVIGNEGRGLAPEDVELCDERVTIRMRGHMDSLNAAAAGTVILWEMMRGSADGDEA